MLSWDALDNRPCERMKRPRQHRKKMNGDTMATRASDNYRETVNGVVELL
jgi:hypothetical protein